MDQSLGGRPHDSYVGTGLKQFFCRFYIPVSNDSIVLSAVAKLSCLLFRC